MLTIKKIITTEEAKNYLEEEFYGKLFVEKSKEEIEGLFLQILEMYEATGKELSLEELIKEAKGYGIEDFDISSKLIYNGTNDDIKETVMEKYVITKLLKQLTL